MCSNTFYAGKLHVQFERRTVASARATKRATSDPTPRKVGNRRAPARGGHGTHWREGVARADVSGEGNIVETLNSVAMSTTLDRLSAPNQEKIPEERW